MDNYSSDLDRDDLVRKYMLAKMSGQPTQDELDRRQALQSQNADLESQVNNTNLMAGINNASAMISGGRVKADNSDLDASNKNRVGEVAANNKALAAGQEQSSKEREDAIKEYLAGKRSDEIQNRMLSINENNTNLRREIADKSNDTKFQLQDLKNQIANSNGQKKDDQKVGGYISDLGKELTFGPPRAGQDFQRHVAKVSAANALLALGEQGDYQKNGLDSRQIHEAAIAAGALVNGGSGAAQNTVNALVPHSAGPIEARIEEWLTNEPHGASQMAFVDRMLDTAKREKHLAAENLRNYRAQSIDNYAPKLSGSDTGRAQLEHYKSKYLSGAKYDEAGNYQMAPYASTTPAEAGSAIANRNKSAPGTAIAAPAVKDVHTMTKEELLKELGE